MTRARPPLNKARNPSSRSTKLTLVLITSPRTEELTYFHERISNSFIIRLTFSCFYLQPSLDNIYLEASVLHIYSQNGCKLTGGSREVSSWHSAKCDRHELIVDIAILNLTLCRQKQEFRGMTTACHYSPRERRLSSDANMPGNRWPKMVYPAEDRQSLPYTVPGGPVDG